MTVKPTDAQDLYLEITLPVSVDFAEAYGWNGELASPEAMEQASYGTWTAVWVDSDANEVAGPPATPERTEL